MTTKCEFSETQFEAYHSRQLEKFIGSHLPQFFPTRNAEGDIGVDMVHFTKFQSVFIQYKVPQNIRSEYYKCHDLEGNCYRMSIYNKRKDGKPGQYDLLWDWSLTEPLVFYVAPNFNKDQEFYTNYRNILLHSSHFNIRNGFIDPTIPGFNDHKHYVYYSANSSLANIYSKESNAVSKLQGEILLNAFNDINPTEISFVDFINNTNQKIFDLLSRKDLGRYFSKKRKFLLEDLINEKEESNNYYMANYFLREFFGLDWIILASK